jgi:hypothetical protein
MGGPLQKPVRALLGKFSSETGDAKLKLAALWERVLGDYARETQILEMKQGRLFVGIKIHLLAQEIKVRFQRRFLEKYEEEFGEKLKDIRFLLIQSND